MPTIKTLVEQQRGCGYRKKGGLYLIGGAAFSGCCKLSYQLTTCHHCGEGIKFFRGFKWINTSLFALQSCQKINDLFDQIECDNPFRIIDASPIVTPCILSEPNTRIGLMWVGEKWYKSPNDFIRESQNMGVSKRIGTLPSDVEPGKTWIALAHSRGISEFVEQAIQGDGQPDVKTALTPVFTPAIFCVFQVQKIQYVITETETTEELERLEKRGIELVNVFPEGEQQNLKPITMNEILFFVVIPVLIVALVTIGVFTLFDVKRGKVYKKDGLILFVLIISLSAMFTLLTIARYYEFKK